MGCTSWQAAKMCWSCTAAPCEALVSVADPVQTRFAIDNAAMLLFAFSTAGKGTLEMHASVTVKDGKGYLFLGHSGTGKSTHSRQWLETYEDWRVCGYGCNLCCRQ